MQSFCNKLLAESAPGGGLSQFLPRHSIRITVGRIFMEFRSEDAFLNLRFLHQFAYQWGYQIEAGFVGVFEAMLSHAEAQATIHVSLGFE